jgi:hypothetical protein
VRIGYNGLSEFKMCSRQIGFIVKDQHDNSKIDALYDDIINLVEQCSDLYGVNDEIESISILFIEINTLVELRINIPKLDLPKSLIPKKEFKERFSNQILPLTTNIKYYGQPILDEEKKNILNNIENICETINTPYSIKYFNLKMSDQFFLLKASRKNIRGIVNQYIVISKLLNNTAFSNTTNPDSTNYNF